MENKQLPSVPDALIFDMDGTLWDGVQSYADGFNDYFAKAGIRKRFAKDDLKAYMGLAEVPYLEKVLPEYAPEKRKAIYNEVIDFQYKRIKTDGGELYDGVRNGLEKLSEKYRLFVVSNCPPLTIRYFVEWAGIGHLFTDTIAHGENGKHKHENIQTLIDNYILQNPVYVGDTASDQKQSALAGIPFAFVSYGFGQCENPDFRFNSFTELSDYFLGI
ncbi:MAG: HAD family hydrolase [Capnocytophaga sp.]|nr:HAD family hydrolase [Capnocytophaga sp.]